MTYHVPAGTTPASLKTVLSLVEGSQAWTPQGVEKHKAEGLANAPRATLAWYLLRPVTVFFKNGKEAGFALEAFGSFSMLGFLILTVAGIVCAIAIHLLGYATPTASWITGATVGIGALGTAALYCLLSGTVRVGIIGPASWKTYDLETYKRARLSGGDIHPDAHKLISTIAALFPAATFEVDILEQDMVVLDPLLRVNWINPLGIRESEVVFGWNGIFVLEPS